MKKEDGKWLKKRRGQISKLKEGGTRKKGVVGKGASR